MWQRVWNLIMDNFELRPHVEPSEEDEFFEEVSEGGDPGDGSADGDGTKLNKRQRKFLRKQNQYSDVI